MIILIIITSMAFFSYGFLCLTTDHMSEEFKRYGLTKYKKLTGVLEILGAIGLIVGFSYTPILLIASLGLTMLMLLGVITRIRVKDPWYQIIPAFVLMFITGLIFRSYY